MRYAALLIAFLAPLGLLFGQEETKPLTPEEAARKIDEKVTLQMEVKSTGGSSTSRYLNSMANYRDRNNFTIYMPRNVLPAFKKIEIDDPADYYKGKTIQVTGTVSTFRGQIQIKVDDPEQIKVIDKDAEPTKTKSSPKTAKGKGGKPK
jgi:DNA/RNA endonuclease YhcR with UshA esterase domain